MALYRGKADGTFQEIAGLGYLDGNNVGTIVSYGGTGLPAGYLDCDGSAVSRTTYAELFAVIGTTYGQGDGSTTFNLPNLTDKYLKGKGAKNVGANQSAGLPLPVVASGGSHSHTVTSIYNSAGAPSEATSMIGAWFLDNQRYVYSNTSTDGSHTHSITQDTIYKSTNTTVDVNAVIVKFCIKYTKTLGTLAEADNQSIHNDSNGKLAVVYQEMFNMTHPINSVWIQYTANDNPNTLFNVNGKYSSTWEDITSTYNGKSLWFDSSNNAGTSLTGSLPKIEGEFSTYRFGQPWNSAIKTGAFSDSGSTYDNAWAANYDSALRSIRLNFKASNSNSVYSATAGTNVVRPTSTTVKMWKRVS